MNRTKLALATISLVLPLMATAQSNNQTASTSAPLSGQQLHGLIRDAHTGEQYKQLASYYRQQETKYRGEAANEKVERDRRALVNASLMQKYPRPVDSAQYLYDRYVADADDAALHATHYEELAAAAGADRGGQLASTSQGRL